MSSRRILRRIGLALVGLIVALLSLAVAGAIYQTIATKRAERAYPPPGEIVDVGGYSLHIDCVGRGSPTVLLDAGTGEMSADWVWVQQEVSGTTRVFAYDRAGMGWSEMATSKGDGNMTTIGAEIPETTEGVMILGVDTHLDFHVAVAINPLGRTPG